MTAIELKKQLIDRIAVIDDVSFLKAIKTILDAKSSSQKLSLTNEQVNEILESKKQIALGLVTEQPEMDKKFEKWLNENWISYKSTSYHNTTPLQFRQKVRF